MVKERPCYISPTPPKCQKVAVDLKLWLSAPEIPSSQHRVKQSSRGVKFQLTARSGLNLNFSSSLERVSAVQTLSACFATQFHADCQTLLPVGSSTCGWDPANPSRDGHQHSASHLYVLHPMSCNIACKCISNVFFHRLYSRTDAGCQDDKWPHFGNPKIQGQWDRNECSILQTIHPRKKPHLIYKQEVSNFALIFINMKRHNSEPQKTMYRCSKACTISVQFSVCWNADCSIYIVFKKAFQYFALQEKVEH